MPGPKKEKVRRPPSESSDASLRTVRSNERNHWNVAFDVTRSYLPETISSASAVSKRARGSATRSLASRTIASEMSTPSIEASGNASRSIRVYSPVPQPGSRILSTRAPSGASRVNASRSAAVSRWTWAWDS